MGFNNSGIDHVVDRLKHCKYTGILGINIGKNANVPIEYAVNDYLTCMRKAYAVADYICVNISSPNTLNLRQLQFGDMLKNLLNSLKTEQNKLCAEHKKYTPLAVKISPDLTDDEVKYIAQLFADFEIDCVVATNTTIGHRNFSNEIGGLSGAPLAKKSTAIVSILHKSVKIPIIAVGGIMNASDAQEKFDAGASLVQIYSGLIYNGPQLVPDILK